MQLEPTERPARGATWISLMMALQCAVSFALASMTFGSVRDPVGIIAWALLSPPVICAGLLVGIVAWWRTGAVHRARPRRLPWLASGVAGLLLAHWLPMLLWSPIALAYTAVSHGSRAEDHLLSGVFGLAAWGMCAVCIAVLWRLRRSLSVSVDGRPAMLRTSEATWWLEAALVGGYAVPLAVIATVWVAQGDDGGGLTWIAIPLCTGIGMLIAAPLAWCGAAADVESARRSPGREVDWLAASGGRLGGLVAAMALPGSGSAAARRCRTPEPGACRRTRWRPWPSPGWQGRTCHGTSATCRRS